MTGEPMPHYRPVYVFSSEVPTKTEESGAWERSVEVQVSTM